MPQLFHPLNALNGMGDAAYGALRDVELTFTPRLLQLLPVLLVHLVQQELPEVPVLLLLQRVVHVVYVVRDALALVHVLQQVPFQHALYVNQ
jgi:hypothetical protein